MRVAVAVILSAVALCMAGYANEDANYPQGFGACIVAFAALLLAAGLIQ
jgi:hypothetical protein